ncbi:gluconokinase [Sinomonas atrocyanea]|uniref:gluconokinase n=1 Tax=Sinomonas atrocyanea TaxID=37927 RepID=UPI00278065F1|nr:gluconokinase [Sinomonas atrocyanea]MDQ0260667.1 carbohydrate kinase (thermoresistant glucokinase family) [Sinomonas atrocyanea]MDR6621327.1 carbohydrate kinase (thermoresistant glucokinase family) [Sinomonas atrocyanea]
MTDAADGGAFHVVAMGVSGCGKSTVGRLLAQELGGEFLDGDDLHPEANVAKMAAGIPLDDADREPWLRLIGEKMAGASGTMVIGCSALKRAYRDMIRDAAPDTAFVHLHGTRELLAARMAARPGHFMPVSLLDSQLATLEPLQEDERGRVFDIAEQPVQIAREAAEWLRS